MDKNYTLYVFNAKCVSMYLWISIYLRKIIVVTVETITEYIHVSKERIIFNLNINETIKNKLSTNVTPVKTAYFIFSTTVD